MCYSAQIQADYHTFVRAFGAVVDLREFARLYAARAGGAKIKVPKALDAAFSNPVSDEERSIKALADQYRVDQATKLDHEISRQRQRLAEAERVLETRITKKALEDRRIATGKVAWCLSRWTDLQRKEPKARDSRIFPGWYAPVMISENGRRVLKPMRYQCRPQGKPAIYDTKYPGTYNARRDNLEGFWRNQFGVTHGIIVVQSF